MKEPNGLTCALTRADYIHVLQEDGRVSYGCDQDWYGTSWQRTAGCGPTVATNILVYMHRLHGVALPVDIGGKDELVELMEAVWRHVTPTRMGIYLLEQLSDGVHAFARTHGLALESRLLNIPRKRTERPALDQVCRFLCDALLGDCPVAFVNLDNGDVDCLDEWHWVTLVSLRRGPDGGAATVTAYDGDRSFDMDLGLWLETTDRGGGFVYFVAGD